MKKCSRCRVDKPLTEFAEKSARHGTGLTAKCKPCLRKAKEYHVKKTYDISLANYEEMMNEEFCEICKTKMDEKHLDHCHKTGNVRGVLCPRCNHALGHVKDNPDVLKSMIDYLSRNSQT